MRVAANADEDVISAGNELLRQGKPVTGFGLRGLLGGGNHARLVKVWEDHLKAGNAAPVVVDAEFPPELLATVQAVAERTSSAVMQAAKEIFTHAVNEADKRVADLQASAAADVARFESELDAASALADGQLEKLDTQDQVIADLKAQLSAANERLQEQAGREAATSEREKAAQIANEHLSKANSEQLATINKLTGEANAAQTKAAALELANSKMEQQLKQEQDTARLNSERVAAECAEHVKQLGALTKENATLREKMSATLEASSVTRGMLEATENNYHALLAKIGTNNEASKATNATANDANLKTQAAKKVPVKRSSNATKTGGK